MSSLAAARQPDGVRRAAAAVFAAVVVVTVAAFIYTQRVKHLPTPIEHFEVAPSLRVPGGRELITLRTAAPQTVTVEILSAAERLVATPVRRLAVTPAQTLTITWDGRIGRAAVRRLTRTARTVEVRTLARGPLAPAGEYHVTVLLVGEHRTVTLPADFILERR